MLSMYDVLQQAKALKPSQRKELLRLLTRIVEVDEGIRPPPSLRDLIGLGEEYWKGVDSDAYINALRDEWDED